MEEVWKEVKGNELYLISNYGKVFSLISNRELLPYINPSDLYTIKLVSNNERKSYCINRLVMETFSENYNGGHVRHLDNNKHNNKFDNLYEVIVKKSNGERKLKGIENRRIKEEKRLLREEKKLYKLNNPVVKKEKIKKVKKVKVVKESLKPVIDTPYKPGSLYVRDRELLYEVILSKGLGKPTSKLINTLVKMVNNILYKTMRNNNELKYDMRQDAVLLLLKVWNRFNEKKYDSPFSFYTEVIKRSFAMTYNYNVKGVTNPKLYGTDICFISLSDIHTM